MTLEERRAWLESKVGQKIPAILWDELVRSRHARAGEMDEKDEELLLGRLGLGFACDSGISQMLECAVAGSRPYADSPG